MRNSKPFTTPVTKVSPSDVTFDADPAETQEGQEDQNLTVKGDIILEGTSSINFGSGDGQLSLDAENVEYLSGVIPGKAQGGKVLVLDNEDELKGACAITVGSLTAENGITTGLNSTTQINGIFNIGSEILEESDIAFIQIQNPGRVEASKVLSVSKDRDVGFISIAESSKFAINKIFVETCINIATNSKTDFKTINIDNVCDLEIIRDIISTGNTFVTSFGGDIGTDQLNSDIDNANITGTLKATEIQAIFQDNSSVQLEESIEQNTNGVLWGAFYDGYFNGVPSFFDSTSIWKLDGLYESARLFKTTDPNGSVPETFSAQWFGTFTPDTTGNIRI